MLMCLTLTMTMLGSPGDNGGPATLSPHSQAVSPVETIEGGPRTNVPPV